MGPKRIRLRWWARFGLGLAAASLVADASGCTLIRVANLVSKRFVPALGKGDRSRLEQASSRRLGRYWAAFTEAEIRAAVGGGSSGDGKQGKGKRRRRRRPAPGIKLISFKHRGHRAVLRVRRGTERFAFTCRYERGGWRVDDVEFTQRGRSARLSEVLEVLVAAKGLQRGLARGDRSLLLQVASEGFRKRVLSRISDADLRALADSGLSDPESRRSARSHKKRSRIRTEVLGDRAYVTVTGTSLPLVIELMRRAGRFRVDRVRIRLGGAWHSLCAVLDYLGPTLSLLRWAQAYLGQRSGSGSPDPQAIAELIRRLRALLSDALWRESFGWMRAEHLVSLPWDRIRGWWQGDTARPSVKGARRVPRRGAALSPEAVERLVRAGDRLTLVIRLGAVHGAAGGGAPGVRQRPGSQAARRSGAVSKGQHLERIVLEFVRESGRWRVAGGSLRFGGSSGGVLSVPALLRTGGQIFRLAAAVDAVRRGLEGADSRELGQAAARLMRSLRRVSTRALGRALWGHLPAGAAAALVRWPGLRALLGSGGTQRRASPSSRGGRGTTPRVSGLAFRVGRSRISIAGQAGGLPVRLAFALDRGAYRLAEVGVVWGGRQWSLRTAGPLLLPAIQIGYALVAQDLKALGEAFAAPLRSRVVGDLVRVLGRSRLRRLLAWGSEQLARALSRRRSAQASRAARQRGAAQGLQLQLQPSQGTASVVFPAGGGESVVFALVRGPHGVYRIAEVAFPLGGRTRRLSRLGPMLVPVVGFALALLEADLGGLRRASARAFRRGVWRSMRRSALQRFVRRITGGRQLLPIPAPRSGQGAVRPRPLARSPAGPPARAATVRPAAAGLRLVALRLRDRVRYPWAEIELMAGGRHLLVSVVRERRAWRVHDVKVEMGGLMLSLRKVLALGL